MHRKLLLLTLTVLTVIALSGCRQVYTNADDYQQYLEKIPGSADFMPNLTDLSDYRSYDIYYYEYLGQSINLIITYSAEQYESAKDVIVDSYIYFSDPLMEREICLIPEPKFEYNSYTIKVVDDDNFDYPEQFGMIGYSDIKHQISFLFFFDDSLNRLEDHYGTMVRFIENEFWFPED